MTARPGRRTRSLSSASPFPKVEVPERVHVEARRLRDFEAVEVVQEYLRGIHGPMPDHLEDRAHWLAWVEAVEERALSFLEEGFVAEKP